MYLLVCMCLLHSCIRVCVCVCLIAFIFDLSTNCRSYFQFPENPDNFFSIITIRFIFLCNTLFLPSCLLQSILSSHLISSFPVFLPSFLPSSLFPSFRSSPLSLHLLILSIHLTFPHSSPSLLLSLVLSLSSPSFLPLNRVSSPALMSAEN